MPLAESLGAMDALVKAGKIRAIGLSQYRAERLDEAMKAAEANGFTRPCALQTWYNLVERPKLEGELRDTALAHGLGIVPFYGLANGFLTGKYRSKDDLDKSDARPAQRRISRGTRAARARGDGRVAAETGAALATIALAWTNAQPGITSTLASATSVEQLEETYRGAALRLTPDQIALLDEASSLAFLEHVQRGDRQRFGRGGDHRFRIGRPERAVQRRQLLVVAVRRVPFVLGHAADPEDQAFDLTCPHGGTGRNPRRPCGGGTWRTRSSPKCCLNSAAVDSVKPVGVERLQA